MQMKKSPDDSFLHPFLLVSGEPSIRVARIIFRRCRYENNISCDDSDDDSECVHRIDAHLIIGVYQEQDER